MKKSAIILAMYWAAAVQAATYSVTDLGALSELPGQTVATINAVNSSGKAVGISATNNTYLSFIYGGARTNLGTLGGTNCYAQGINVSNIACGTSLNASGNNRAFRWTPGSVGGVAGNPQMADLGTLPAFSDSEANEINVGSQIAGECFDVAGNVTASRFNTNGTILNIGTLLPNRLSYSYGWGINSNGFVVGTAYDANFQNPQAFLYTNTANITLLGDLTGGGGGGPAEAYAVNNSAQVTGYAINSLGDYHAFRWRTNFMADLGTLGGTASTGSSINNSNVIVGESTIDSGDITNHAFIVYSNVMVDLNGLLDASSNGWVLVKAEYINDAGLICGNGTLNGVLHGFLLTPAVAGIAPAITNQPSPLSVLAGSNATFSVVAGGTVPLAYQWRLNTATNLVGATNASLTITNVQATNAGNYTVVITNSFGSITSSPAALSVKFPPNITNQPAPVSIVAGSNATFTILAGGTLPLAYQWRLNISTNLLSATNASLTITNAQATNVGSYTVVITNAYGSITSSPAGLTVNFPPAITNPPAGQTVLVGNNVSFNVGATGTSPLAYQWNFAAAILPAATNLSLTITNSQATNAGNYTVVVTNAYGSSTSAPAFLNVVTAPFLTSISVVKPNVLLGFTTSTGATYFVDNRTNLSSALWLNVISNIAGVGGTKTVTQTNGAGQPAGFYRVRVTVP